jgi:hypothetical protein
MLLWMADKLSDAAETSQEDRAYYRRLLLTIPFRFIVVPTEEERMYKHINLRESITIAHQLMSRSSLQRIFEVCQWRERRLHTAGQKRGTPAVLAADWKANIVQAGGTEPISEAWIASAIRLWEQTMSMPSLMEILVAAEARWGKESPFDSITKMEAVLARASRQGTGSSERVQEWIFDSMVWYKENGFLSTGEMSVRLLTGKNAGNRGLIDMFLMKQAMLRQMSSTIEEIGLPAEAKVDDFTYVNDFNDIVLRDPAADTASAQHATPSG